MGLYRQLLPILAGIRDPRVFIAVTLASCYSLHCTYGGTPVWSTMGLTLPGDLLPHDVSVHGDGAKRISRRPGECGFRLLRWECLGRSISYTPAFLAAGLMPLFCHGLRIISLDPDTNGVRTPARLTLRMPT